MKSILRPSAGHILDIEPSELAPQVLSLAHNVHMRRGFPSRIRGRRSIYGTVPTDPYHLLNVDLNSLNWWMLFGADDIHAVETSNTYDISISMQTTIQNPSEWSSTLLNGIPVFTNGADAPHYWNGEGVDPVFALPDWPAGTVCKFIVAFRFHLFALNISSPGGVFGNMILWSEATEPGAIPQSWTPTASNEAGSAFLADTVGHCVAGAPLGTQLMIYKPASFYAVEYAGQQPDNIFAIRPVVQSTGLLSPHALKTIGTTQSGTAQSVVGNDDVVLVDGINARSIADGRIKRALRNSIDSENSHNVFTIYDNHARELWVCIPETGSQFATVAHIWDQRRDNWVTKDLNAVRYGTTGRVNDMADSPLWNDDSQPWDSDLTVWNEVQHSLRQDVVMAESSAMFLEDTAEPTALSATIQRIDIPFEDVEQIKITSLVRVEGSGAGLNELFVRLGARNSPSESIQWGAYVQRKAEGNEYEVAGRYISVEVTSDGDQPWTVSRIIVEAEPDGTY